MTQANYSLEVISHHPQFKNKNLRKYYVDGIDTVGAWGDEPFEIKFTNHSWQKVQVKISLDGTDVLSGATANTSIDNNMWVVNGYGTMSLKAWPEDNQGGAAFVFTSANNSVAVHTHGDLSARGIIAVAVFTEGHVEPIRYNYPRPIVITQPVYPYPYNQDYWYTLNDYTITCGGIVNNNQTFSSSNVLRGIQSSNNSISLQNCGSNMMSNSVAPAAVAADNGASYFSGEEKTSSATGHAKGLETLVSVGAGQHVDQKINYVQGLIKPIFSETVRVRYLWWDSLVEKLQANNVPAPHASGFPGDKNKKNIDLGGTPRIGSYHQPAFPRAQAPVYARV
jgi:hypothetical protein